METVKNAHLGIRIRRQMLQDFQDKCRTDLGKDPSDVLRELIQAFNQGRLKIERTETEKELYK